MGGLQNPSPNFQGIDYLQHLLTPHPVPDLSLLDLRADFIICIFAARIFNLTIIGVWSLILVVGAVLYFIGHFAASTSSPY